MSKTEIDEEKRDFMKATPVVLSAGWLDEDGDGDFLDDLLGLNNTKSSEELDFYVGKASERADADPESAAAFFAIDSGAWYRPTETGWEKVKSTGKNPNVESIQAVRASIADELDVSGSPSGSVPPTGRVSFNSEFIDEPFGSSTFDPEIVHRRHYDDGKYRVIVGNSSTNETSLYTTTDFNSFTKVEADILPNVSGSGQVAGAEVLNDGKHVVLTSTDSNTDLYTGSDLQSLSKDGQFCSEPDGGTFYDSENGVLHYYPEDADTASGVSSNKLSHYTAPDTDLLNTTKHSDAFDGTSEVWKTGDPDIIQVGDWYVMFLDRTENHPNYHIALAVGKTLGKFEIVDSNITPDRMGGDLAITRRNGYFEALTEYSGGNKTIGHWRLWPYQQTPLQTNNQLRGASPGPEFWDRDQNEKRMEAVSDPSNAWSWHIHQDPNNAAGSGDAFGLRLIDADGSEVGNWVGYNGESRLQAPSGGTVALGIAGSGQVEMSVTEDSVSFAKFINMAPQSSTPSSPSTNDIYLDDGTNTADGNEGFRRYDGSAWVDIG